MIENYLKMFTDWLLPEEPVYTEKEKALQIIEQLRDSEAWLRYFAADEENEVARNEYLKEAETASIEITRLELELKNNE